MLSYSTVLVKIFKLLVNELGNLNESILLDEEAENSDEDDSQEDIGNGTENGSSPQKILRTSDLWQDDEEDEDDQLLKELEQDPIFKASMSENLTKFLQNFTKTEQFAEFAQHLNENEKNILSGIHI